MLSRLPISLAKLKAGNNSEKCKNDNIKNYSILCIIQNNYLKQSTNIRLVLIEKIETIFMNTENSRTNESNRFIYEFIYLTMNL